MQFRVFNILWMLFIFLLFLSADMCGIRDHGIWYKLTAAAAAASATSLKCNSYFFFNNDDNCTFPFQTILFLSVLQYHSFNFVSLAMLHLFCCCLFWVASFAANRLYFACCDHCIPVACFHLHQNQNNNNINLKTNNNNKKNTVECRMMHLHVSELIAIV